MIFSENRFPLFRIMLLGVSTMHLSRRFVVAIALLSMAFTSTAFAEGKTHRIAVHVDQNDPQVMNMALNNVTNVIEYYRGRNE
jgi:uncharacterized protein